MIKLTNIYPIYVHESMTSSDYLTLLYHSYKLLQLVWVVGGVPATTRSLSLSSFLFQSDQWVM